MGSIQGLLTRLVFCEAHTGKFFFGDFPLVAASTYPISASWPVCFSVPTMGNAWYEEESKNQCLPAVWSWVPTLPAMCFCFLTWQGRLMRPNVPVSMVLQFCFNLHYQCLIFLLDEWCFFLNIAVGHGLWVRRYQEKKSLFDVPESDGSSLSPVTAAVYSFLTMIIVLQVTVLSTVR